MVNREEGKTLKVVVVMEGGIVQSVFCSSPADVAVVDYDTDDADQTDPHFIKRLSLNGDDCYVRICGAEPLVDLDVTVLASIKRFVKRVRAKW